MKLLGFRLILTLLALATAFAMGSQGGLVLAGSTPAFLYASGVANPANQSAFAFQFAASSSSSPGSSVNTITDAYTTGTNIRFAGIDYGYDGNLYVATTSGQHNVLQINPITGAINQFGGANSTGGAAGAAFGPDGNFYVADAGRGQIVQYQGPDTSSPGTSQVFANNVTGVQDVAFGPNGTMYASTSSYVGNGNYGQLMQIGPTGSITVLASGFSSTTAVGGLTVGSDGSIYVASNNNIDKFSSSGSLLNTFTGVVPAFNYAQYEPGNTPPSFVGVRFGSDGNLYAADTANGVIDEFNPSTGAASLLPGNYSPGSKNPPYGGYDAGYYPSSVSSTMRLPNWLTPAQALVPTSISGGTQNSNTLGVTALGNSYTPYGLSASGTYSFTATGTTATVNYNPIGEDIVVAANGQFTIDTELNATFSSSGGGGNLTNYSVTSTLLSQNGVTLFGTNTANGGTGPLPANILTTTSSQPITLAAGTYELLQTATLSFSGLTPGEVVTMDFPNNSSVDSANTAAPAPASLALFSIGAWVLLGYAWRQRQSGRSSVVAS